jgi:hypothetical protein
LNLSIKRLISIFLLALILIPQVVMYKPFIYLAYDGVVMAQPSGSATLSSAGSSTEFITEEKLLSTLMALPKKKLVKKLTRDSGVLW